VLVRQPPVERRKEPAAIGHARITALGRKPLDAIARDLSTLLGAARRVHHVLLRSAGGTGERGSLRDRAALLSGREAHLGLWAGNGVRKLAAPLQKANVACRLGVPGTRRRRIVLRRAAEIGAIRRGLRASRQPLGMTEERELDLLVLALVQLHHFCVAAMGAE